MAYKLAIIVNKDEGSLGSSETFLLAHINDMPCEVLTLIGNPGYRIFEQGSSSYMPSRAFMPLSLRWAARQLKFSTVKTQDTKAVSKFLKREQVNAVLAEYGPTAVSVIDACRDAAVPLIAHFHGYDAYTEHCLAANESGYQVLFETSATIVAVSQHMRDQLISLGANPANTFHNSCGAEIPDGLTAGPGLADIRFLMVGRLTPKKAPLNSITAFSKIVVQYPAATLDIVGDGPLRQECEERCKQLGLQNNVALHGAKTHDEVLQFMTKARCFVQHSVRAEDGDHEGTPVGVLEAMGMGLPVVATRHGGIVDVVDEDITGSLIDEGDVDGMAAAMKLYAENPELAQSVGEKARSVILENWTSEKSVDRLWKIIQQASANQ